MKNICSILLLVITPCISVAGDLKSFESDGCSSFPDGTIEQKGLWLKCCVEHDKAYWVGGTHKEREAADEALKKCVADMGEPGVALLMQ